MLRQIRKRCWIVMIIIIGNLNFPQTFGHFIHDMIIQFLFKFHSIFKKKKKKKQSIEYDISF